MGSRDDKVPRNPGPSWPPCETRVVGSRPYPIDTVHAIRHGANRARPRRGTTIAVASGEVSEWLKEHAWKVCIG